MGPGDDAGVEQHAEPVVVEPAKTMAAALDLLNAEVEALGRTVRCAGRVPVEDLNSPRFESVAERSDLGDLVVPAAGDGTTAASE